MSPARVAFVALTAIAALASAAPVAAAPDRSKPPTPGTPKPFTIAAPDVFKLKNGLEVWFLQRSRAPLVDVVAVVDAGHITDPQGSPGLAKWTADMLTEGSAGMSTVQFSDALKGLGAEVASTGEVDHAWMNLHVTSARFPDAIKLFAQALTRPDFADGEWKRLRGQLFGEMTFQAQEPQELAALATFRAAWGAEHRLGINRSGTPKALMAVTSADLTAFHQARYRPDTTTLIVVGDLDKKGAKKALEDAFGGWSAVGPPPPAPALVPPAAKPQRALYTVQVPEAPQTVLQAFIPAPAGTLPFTPDIDVMNTLLGGSFSSRLNQNLREKNGYSYGASSRLATNRSGAFFVVRSAVNAPTTAPALKEILAELERIKTPADDEEVVRARNVAALSVPSAFDNGRSTASQWAFVAAQRLDKGRLQKFMEQAPKVDAKVLQAAAERIVRTDVLGVVAVGDIEAHLKGDAGVGPRVVFTVEELLPGIGEAAAALGGGG